MTLEHRDECTTRSETAAQVRNPYGMRDVPNPNSQEVAEFAETIHLDGSTTDENASAWFSGDPQAAKDTIQGKWSSRWNGGPDPTISNDTKEKWKPGQAEVRLLADRVYVLFD